MQLEVANDRWVTVRYRLFDSSGEAVEDGEREITYLHGGYGDLFEPIERTLEGRVAGFEASLYLGPGQTFGDYDPGLVRLVPRASLPADLEAGMSFEGVPGEASDGRIWIATDIAGEQVVLDGNHPLAGMALRFELRIVSVTEAGEDEIAGYRLRGGEGR